LRRYAAPAAFLLAVTIGVLAVHYGVQQGTKRRPAPPAAVPTSPRTTRKPAPAARYYTVLPGDSFSSIAAKTHTGVTRIERLNPGVSSSSLHVGQRIRVE
jgi:LysM repeat protein